MAPTVVLVVGLESHFVADNLSIPQPQLFPVIHSSYCTHTETVPIYCTVFPVMLAIPYLVLYMIYLMSLPVLCQTIRVYGDALYMMIIQLWMFGTASFFFPTCEERLLFQQWMSYILQQSVYILYFSISIVLWWKPWHPLLRYSTRGPVSTKKLLYFETVFDITDQIWVQLGNV